MYLLPGDAGKEKSKMTPIASSKKAQEKKIVLIPVADPGFPQRWGRQLPGGRQHTILPTFPKNCMKLKEFGLGGRRPKFYYVDPPLHTHTCTQCTG